MSRDREIVAAAKAYVAAHQAGFVARERWRYCRASATGIGQVEDARRLEREALRALVEVCEKTAP